MVKNNLRPKVSVMISVYNQLHCLPKALESVLVQDYPNLEIIISDDCSTDGNIEQFLEKYADKRIKYFQNSKNIGVSKHYFQMLNVYASGVYAIVLNADDYWTDDSFISKAVSIFEEDPEITLVFGDVKVLIQGNQTFYEDQMHKKISRINDGNLFFLDYADGYSLPHLTCLYNRQIAISLNFYSEEGVSEDWGSLLKIIIDKKIGYISNTVGVITKHLLNYTKDTNIQNLFIADNYIDNLYLFASKSQGFNTRDLELWRFNMLKRHHVKWLMKLWFLDKAKLQAYKNFVSTKHPKIYSSIRMDFRYWGYLCIRWSPKLLKFVFKRIISQESFVVDLLVHKTEEK